MGIPLRIDASYLSTALGHFSLVLIDMDSSNNLPAGHYFGTSL